jgi:hypothetical protein
LTHIDDDEQVYMNGYNGIEIPEHGLGTELLFSLLNNKQS